VGLTDAHEKGSKFHIFQEAGSVVKLTNASGALVVHQQRYLPFISVRTDVGLLTQTDFGYTGQHNLDDQNNNFSFGLMDYNARFYYPALPASRSRTASCRASSLFSNGSDE
jgi:hypothetical protein